MPAPPMPAAQTQPALPAAIPTGRRDLSTSFPAPASFAASMVAALAASGAVAPAATVAVGDPSTASAPDMASQIAPILGTAPAAVDTTAGNVAPVGPDAAAGRPRAPAPRSGKDAGNNAAVTDTPPPLPVQMIPVSVISVATPVPQPSAPQSPERGVSGDGAKLATQASATAASVPPNQPLPTEPAPPPGASPPTPQQPEPPPRAGAVRADAGPADRVRGLATSAGPAAPATAEPPAAKPSPVAATPSAPSPVPPDAGADALLHAAAGQVAAAASAMPSTPPVRTVVSVDARVAPSAATEQVMPAMVSLATGAGGSHSMTVRLDPASLGAVQIRIDRPVDAPARVDITADRPETLALLQGDQHHLQQALDQAGIPAEGRQLSFHAAAPSPDSAAQPSRSDVGSGGSGQGQAGQNAPRTRRGPGGAGGEAALDGAASSGWLRAGVDITA